MWQGEKIVEIIRIGTLDIPSFRYIDIIELSQVEKITLFIKSSEYNRDIGLLNQAIDLFSLGYLQSKIEVRTYHENLFDRLYKKVQSRLAFMVPLADRFYLLSLKRKLKNICLDKQIIWCGDNDYDGSNLLVFSCRGIFFNKGLRTIRSYKETRFKRSSAEKKMLQLFDAYIFPNQRYPEFFERLYGQDFL